MNGPADKWIMHLDMDAFFASVEQRDHPEYQSRPVIVGAKPGSRGVVATCSYEARQYGVRSAMPVSEAYRRCPQGIYVSPSMSSYVEASTAIMAILGEISPIVEPISIDEAFLDISGLERLMGDPGSIARHTKQKIIDRTGLNCSVGVGPNRLIAKLASEHDKPNGLLVVEPEAVEAFLDPLPVSDLRGVGKQTLKALHRLGLYQVRQLRAYDHELLVSQFGEKGARHLYNQSRGIASDQVGTRSGRKSISKEHTFGTDVTDQRVIRDCLRRLSAEVARSARKKGLAGHLVTLKVRWQGFETHTRQKRVNQPHDTDNELFRQAWELYRLNDFGARPIRLVGVGLSIWESSEPLTGDLFDTPADPHEQRRIYETLDEVSDKFGQGTLTLGLQKR